MKFIYICILIFIFFINGVCLHELHKEHIEIQKQLNFIHSGQGSIARISGIHTQVMGNMLDSLSALRQLIQHGQKTGVLVYE